MEDLRLIERILNGEQDAYRIFIEQYKKLVFHVIYRLIANQADREDICQDVFLKAFANLGSFKSESKVSTWLARIAYNTAVNHLAKKRPDVASDHMDNDDLFTTIPVIDDNPHEWTERNEKFEILNAQINSLKPIYKTIITLYHWDEMSYEEISDTLDIPVGTVKNYLFRARQIIKEKMSEVFEENQ